MTLGVAQLVGYMLSLHEALGSIPHTMENQGEWWIPEVPVPQDVRQEDQRFEVILVYVASLSLAWAT